MSAAIKFDNFVNDLVNGVHKNGINTGSPTDSWKVYLTNATPSVSADSVKADLAEIGTGNGYPGASDISLQRSQSGGVITLSGTNVVITCTAGSPSGIGPFQYVVLFNDTPAAPLDPLICAWDIGVSLSLEEGQSLTVNLGSYFGTIQ
jgi:hypothetical protein